MNTTESNKKIAEFMGGVFVETNATLESNGYALRKDGSENPVFFYEFDLPYDKSWDWLMPVVEKIEITSVDGEDNSDEFFNVVIEVFECNINGSGRTVCGVGQNKIEATYKAVAEFIKWYNKNK